MQADQSQRKSREQRLSIHPYEEKHASGLRKLAAAVFGAPAVEALFERLSWVDAIISGEAPRRFALLDRDELVGFVATVPMIYRLGGRSVVAHTPAEFMVRPDRRFHGIRLMKECLDAVENCVSCDDVDATIEVSRYLGLVKVGRVVRYSKILDSRVLLERAGVDHLPAIVWRIGNSGLASLDALRRIRRGGPPVRESVCFDSRFDALFDEMSNEQQVSVERSSRFLRWRYGAMCPQVTREIGVVENGHRMEGYVTLHRSMRRGEVGRILDMQALGPWDRAATKNLLAHAVNRLRALGARRAWYHRLDSASSVPEEILRREGFEPRSEHVLMVRFIEERDMSLASGKDRWSFAMGDSEASFFAR